MKPIYIGFQSNGEVKMLFNMGVSHLCPMCKSGIYTYWNYCPQCGQKIDWS